jgi:hypothetical protein
MREMVDAFIVLAREDLAVAHEVVDNFHVMLHSILRRLRRNC